MPLCEGTETPTRKRLPSVRLEKGSGPEQYYKKHLLSLHTVTRKQHKTNLQDTAQNNTDFPDELRLPKLKREQEQYSHRQQGCCRYNCRPPRK